MRQYFIFIISILFLTACATELRTLQNDNTKVLEEGVGYLLLGIQTNRNLKRLQISGRKTIKFSHKDLTYGSNFLLIELPAGTYAIDEIYLNDYMMLEVRDKKYWKFKVLPGKINYVGHLEISRTGFWSARTDIELVNRSSEAVEFLEDEFPNILSNRALSYGGPGDDKFFEYLFPLPTEEAN